MTRHILLFISMVLCICIPAQAQMLKDSVLINFRQSKIYLDTAYMGNTQSLQHARKVIEFYHRPDSNFVLTNVTVEGGASPEGSVSFNEWLSRKRAARIFDYIGAHFNLPDSLTTFTFYGRDWVGLRKMVEADPKVPYRDEVLSLLDEIISTYKKGEKESHGLLARIKKLRKGVPYKYMYKNLFPTLRASKLVLTFDNPHPVAPPKPYVPITDMSRLTSPLEIEMPAITFSFPPAPAPVPPLPKPFYMGLKTNMLYDLLAVPNIGAEFYLGKNISIVGNWMYGWWKNDPSSFYWRIYGGDLALRWWFGKEAHEKPLTGHHLGIYGSLLTWDFELGGRGYMGGVPRGAIWDKCNHFFGVEYGYSLPIARRWNIDFNIGIGYWGGVYQVYDPVDNCYVYRETRRMHYVGPTKAEVSLVWLIGRGNYNKKFDKLANKLRKEAGL